MQGVRRTARCGRLRGKRAVEWLTVEVRNGEHLYYQRFERGTAVTELEEREATTETGTTVIFERPTRRF